MRTRINLVLVLSLMTLSLSCSSGHRKQKMMAARVSEHAILRALDARDRNSVYVAIRTLQDNGLPVSQRIEFDKPYAEVRREVQALRADVTAYPEETLNTLDNSLSEHWPRYSPIWVGRYWP